MVVSAEEMTGLGVSRACRGLFTNREKIPMCAVVNGWLTMCDLSEHTLILMKVKKDCKMKSIHYVNSSSKPCM